MHIISINLNIITNKIYAVFEKNNTEVSLFVQFLNSEVRAKFCVMIGPYGVVIWRRASITPPPPPPPSHMKLKIAQ